MDQYWDETEHVLSRLENLVTHGRRGRPTDVRRHLAWLQHLLLRQEDRGLDPAAHEALHGLLRRAEMARDPAELRDLVRDIRQYHLAIASRVRALDTERRLHELECQVKGVAEAATVQATTPQPEVVTLASLKGKRLLFVIMPFAKDFDDVWLGGIKRAASGTGFTPIRIDMITQSSEITDDIVQAIRMAELVVVDVTGNNPNVMFEFGFALALKKRHAVISQSAEYLPFDIKSLRTLSYRNSWQGVEALHKDLQAFIKGAATGTPRSARKVKRRRRRAKVTEAKKP
jgi:hypothetical protein